jgi:hypothetical protein
MNTRWPALLSCLALALPALAEAESRLFTFSWPFSAEDEMRPRGGTSAGAPVELAEAPTPAWLALREPGLDAFERDRRAILGMAGGYRVSFDFIETVGLTGAYQPARPYQSWATEVIYVEEDRGDFIALQHILVMLFAAPDGEVIGPIVQRHWRQEWQFEPPALTVYAGRNRFERRVLTEHESAGQWMQRVLHVDDSPRYEAVGRWTHEGNYSAWTSEPTWRPLPRREESVRDDYHVLAGTNRHTITPDGWVHEQDNLKLVLDASGEPAGGAPWLARELGVNRYQLLAGFDFSAGDRYFERTAPFWADVRAEWDRLRASRDRFELLEQHDGRALFEHLFDYAERLHAGGRYDAADSRSFAARMIDAYLR